MLEEGTLEFFEDGSGIKGPRPNATSENMKVNFHCDEQCPNLCMNSSKFEVHHTDLTESSNSYVVDSSISFACEGKIFIKHTIL